MRPPSYSPSGTAPEPWDEAEAAALLGQYALVGVTWVRDDGEEAGQYHGRIVAADRETGIVIACEGKWEGETLVLPPASGWFDPAAPGEYRLRSTGEVVVDPDLVSTWRITANAR